LKLQHDFVIAFVLESFETVIELSDFVHICNSLLKCWMAN